MSATAYADPRPLLGTALPKLWNGQTRRSTFGDIVLIVFLLAQCLDGVFTYVGVVSFGTGVEGNPLIVALMAHLGHGFALMTAKALAATFGIVLHMREVHLAVALLAGFYLLVAVLPWIAILFG